MFTPYAVHGMDRAHGPAAVPPAVGRASCSACLARVAMAVFQYWASAVDWPINVGGKPWHSWPAFVPVIFEVMVLLRRRRHGRCVLLVWAGLKPGAESPLSDLRVTDDRFALVLRSRTSTGPTARSRGLLRRSIR